jgi:CheY-like chemotaxis protein/DNA-binding XRE family transcriptional regulator
MGLSYLHELDFYIGKRIREKRQKLNMSLNDMSEKLGISYQQIQKYEQGHVRISANTLYNISRVLGVPAQYFFEGFEFKDSNVLKNTLGHISGQVCKKPLNILLVEDDSVEELITRKALEDPKNLPVKVFCVHDGDQAIDFLKNRISNVDFSRPDIIILDLNLPKRNGHELLKEIKRNNNLQDIPVIILTNSICLQEVCDLYRHYASGYINKSFDFNLFKENLSVLIKYWSSSVVLPNRA